MCIRDRQGYSFASLILASAVVNCQFVFTHLAFRLTVQLRTCFSKLSKSGNGFASAWRFITPISDVYKRQSLAQPEKNNLFLPDLSVHFPLKIQIRHINPESVSYTHLTAAIEPSPAGTACSIRIPLFRTVTMASFTLIPPETAMAQYSPRLNPAVISG